MLVADIIRFTKEDKYKILFVEYVTSSIYGFNLCVKIEQTAAINIVRDITDFTVEGWKIGKVIPTFFNLLLSLVLLSMSGSWMPHWCVSVRIDAC